MATLADMLVSAADMEVATAHDVDALATMLSDAFATDPMVRWPMPTASHDAIREQFRAILRWYVPLGVVWKIDNCRGAAAWLPPSETDRLTEIEPGIRSDIASLTSDGGARYSKFWDWLGTHAPDEPCWLLDLVGVSPEAQGQGLGQRLVTHGLERARAMGCSAFLETGNERNVAYYQSLGFRTVDQEQAPDDGPVIWFMQTAQAQLSSR